MVEEERGCRDELPTTSQQTLSVPTQERTRAERGWALLSCLQLSTTLHKPAGDGEERKEGDRVPIPPTRKQGAGHGRAWQSEHSLFFPPKLGKLSPPFCGA